MVFDPGLWCGDRTILFCTEDIHSDRLRLRRCGKRTHDSYLFTAVSAGRLAVGGNLVADAFGVVAMVAMTPLITIQILGMVYQLKQQKSGAGIFAGAADAFGALDENAIIEL